MAWDTFVYDNIKKQLVKEGFSEALAQGGQTMELITIAVCRRRAAKGWHSTIASPEPGSLHWLAVRRTRSQRRRARKQKAAQLQLHGLH
ncbi:hypothetical protein FHU12_3239 [Serratia marcescens]|uniref:Uncharacterized protein n=1 Tax=Serratia marcescens TaxID=615 RepID=A0AA46K8E8_SERMA|nr:hypothetical protein [Serratia marcescens]TQI85670.1 hypothetical protein FHU12_3239 [Serratia marcescens]HEJ7121063.1 hypothetical protein [Serratia marcescens]